MHCYQLLISLSLNVSTAYGPNSTWLVSTQLDTFDFVEQVETSVLSRAVPTWRTANKL